jgi:addiction module HigA family antidote
VSVTARESLPGAAGAAPPGAAPARRRATALRASSRRPPRPGDFLESRYMKPLSINQTELAQALGISRRRVNELINGKRGITPDTAVRLALFFGNEPTFWMHLQVAWDMHVAMKELNANRRK